MHTVIQEKILESVNIVSKLLQKSDMDIFHAVGLLDSAYSTISKLRSEYDQVKSTAKELAASWGSSSQFAQKRTGRTKRHFDELSVDQRLTCPDERFKVTVFYGCIDIIVSQLKHRFTAMDAIAKRFYCLCPRQLTQASDDELHASAEALALVYENDLSAAFPTQLLSFRNALRSEITSLEKGSIKELAELLFLKNASIMASVTDVATALKLFLTIPVTVASAERSFSKLKIIKTYLRSTMSQERLSGLAVLSIENQRARQMDLGAVIREFAKKNVRREGRFGRN